MLGRSVFYLHPDGKTVICERWESLNPDCCVHIGHIQPHRLHSYSPTKANGIADFMYESVHGKRISVFRETEENQ